METVDREILWRQFASAIDSFGSALRNCPESLWDAQLWEDQPDQWVAAGFSSFWYLGYHTLFWLDLYLRGEEEEKFAPPPPFDLVEMKRGEQLPRLYTRDELLTYHTFCRDKCQAVIGALTDDEAYRICRYPWGEVSYAELLLYNMRHVQEHAAQMHMFLGQHSA